ncbi:MAG: type II toxin-antitoxin system HicB family antitoxin [Hyphomicrobiales bacterium]
MRYYMALLHARAGGYDVTVPDLPGCTASGRSVPDAMRAGAEAMRLWAEAEASAGRAVPAPSKADTLRSAPDVAEEVAGGALAAMLPLLADAGRSQRINITMDAGLLEAVDAAARARGLTRSAFLASAARDKIAG